MATSAKKVKASRENGKKGGRKTGSLNQSTLDKMKVAKIFNQKAMAAADILFNSKLHVATGQSFLYKIEKYYVGKGANRELRQKPPKLVTAQWEIEDYLMNRVGSADYDAPEDTYYFMTTERGNSSALEDLINRAIGTVAQKIGLEDDPDGKPQKITGLIIMREGTILKKDKK